MPLEQDVMNIGRQLEKLVSEGNADNDVASDILQRLKELPITLEILQKTKVGTSVNVIRKASSKEDVQLLAKGLIKSWKKLLDQAAKCKQKVDSPPSPPVSKVQKIDTVSNQRINKSPVKVTKSISEAEPLIKKDSEGRLIFPDKKDFKPNLTPMEVMQLGSFGGTYFRPIYSSVTGEKYSRVHEEFPEEWFKGLIIKKHVVSPVYDNNVNKYRVKCGGSLEMWEESGWINKQDPYGWFQWYCRFYMGRRSKDDSRQIDRWARCAGVKGRWRNNLISKCVRSGKKFDNFAVSPVVRQTLQHWGYVLTERDFDAYADKVKL